MMESFPGSLVERRAQGKGGDYVERARKGLGTAGDIAQVLNTARWAVPAAASLFAGGFEVVKSFDGEPDNSAFSWVDDLDIDPATLGFFGLSAILLAYFITKSLSPTPQSSPRPQFENPSWRRAEATS